MINVAACDKTHPQEQCHYYSWLEDYFERLEGKEAYREFQERCYDDPEYFALACLCIYQSAWIEFFNSRAPSRQLGA